jgi:hypothetical protein
MASVYRKKDGRWICKWLINHDRKKGEKGIYKFEYFGRDEVDKRKAYQKKISIEMSETGNLQVNIPTTTIKQIAQLSVKRTTTGRRGYVYVLESTSGLVKVGISATPWRRIIDIENQGGMKIVKAQVLFAGEYCRAVELSIHEELDKHRQVGEWFDVAFDYTISLVSSVIEGIMSQNSDLPISY